MYLSAAVVGVRAFALSRAAFRYTERLASHDAALRQLAVTRTDLVRRLIPLAPDGLTRTRRGSVLGALVDDVDELQNLPLRVVLPLVSSAAVALGAVVLVAVVWWRLRSPSWPAWSSRRSSRSAGDGSPARGPSGRSPRCGPGSPTPSSTISRASTC